MLNCGRQKTDRQLNNIRKALHDQNENTKRQKGLKINSELKNMIPKFTNPLEASTLYLIKQKNKTT